MVHSPSRENAGLATERRQASCRLRLNGNRHRVAYPHRGGRRRQGAVGALTFTGTAFTSYAGLPYWFTLGLAWAPFPSVPGPISATQPIPAGAAGDQEPRARARWRCQVGHLGQIRAACQPLRHL
jgi:hypothetical protein